ncbi:hypothetical protein AA309_23830 [Microvirga vignae]|uniref:Uncharacterized protein n=1 Tax=Microvirga vignae TaxID=1225564 RepID=A0A0H1R6E9_9HYPH|nr:hypothetical protein AA309_23830 [Microvirga vignae]
MQRHNPNLDEHGHKLREANIRLARYERLSRIALVLVLVLNLVVLALVMGHLWDHPWTQESLQSGLP